VGSKEWGRKMLKKSQIKTILNNTDIENPLIISPYVPINEGDGAASIDIRIGRWFVIYRTNRRGIVNLYPKEGGEKYDNYNYENLVSKRIFIPFGHDFVLQPKSFALAVTLEWFRFPPDIGGYVIGKSSWGRYGLVIATATGIHPGYTGCLALELSNLGEMPIIIKPGTQICQIFFEKVESASADTSIDKTYFIGNRLPIIPRDIVRRDPIAQALFEVL